jgi:hypothetical protein
MIDIEEIDGSLSELIDQKLVSICIPNSEIYDLPTVKKKILKFLQTKNNNKKTGKVNNIVVGTIVEFMLHLFFISIGFKQEFQFLNLEEGGSMKKGFDGFYTNKNLDWILESKSGGLEKNAHENKINDAYIDLKAKFTGNVTNNPWFNAFNHVKNVKAKKTLIEKIESLSFRYDNKDFEDIKNLNIIPCSTLIMENKFAKINKKHLVDILNIQINKYEYNQAIFVCINKKSLSHFRNYLEN